MQYAFMVQKGRLEIEAIFLVESMLRNAKIPSEYIIAFYPKATDLWDTDPTPSMVTMDYLSDNNIQIRILENEHFGSTYPHSNKIYAIRQSEGNALTFIDTDTFFLRPLKICNLAGSVRLRRGGGTFPVKNDRFTGTDVWESLYAIFDVPPANNLIQSNGVQKVMPMPYYNAGTIMLDDPAGFGDIYLDTAIKIYENPPQQMHSQPILPFLDQIALPIAISRAGKAVKFLDKTVNTFDSIVDAQLWHYHYMPRLLLEGTQKYGSAVSDIIDDPHVNRLVATDPLFVLWSSDRARKAYKRIVSDMNGIEDPNFLIKALRQKVGIVR
jgi:hypothetical protein